MKNNDGVEAVVADEYKTAAEAITTAVKVKESFDIVPVCPVFAANGKFVEITPTADTAIEVEPLT